MNHKMKSALILSCGAAAILLAWFGFRRSAAPIGLQPPASAMRLESAAFAEGGAIPKPFTCDGQGLTPPLAISGAPASAKSLAFILHDPDAPHDFVHWVFWNADAAATDVKEAELPAGAIQGLNGAGKPGYIGPCPPHGMHQYLFELYALDTALDLPATTDAAALRAAMDGHILESTRLTGTYSRP